jgi:hypothetical protein
MTQEEPIVHESIKSLNEKIDSMKRVIDIVCAARRVVQYAPHAPDCAFPCSCGLDALKEALKVLDCHSTEMNEVKQCVEH